MPAIDKENTILVAATTINAPHWPSKTGLGIFFLPYAYPGAGWTLSDRALHLVWP
jgi:hypothetical protein